MGTLADTGLGEYTPFANVAATVIIAGLLVWLLTRFLPALLEGHRTDIKEITNGFHSELALQRASHERVNEGHAQSLKDSAQKNREGMQMLKAGLDDLAKAVQSRSTHA